MGEGVVVQELRYIAGRTRCFQNPSLVKEDLQSLENFQEQRATQTHGDEAWKRDRVFEILCECEEVSRHRSAPSPLIKAPIEAGRSLQSDSGQPGYDSAEIHRDVSVKHIQLRILMQG
jgi:hypothetical protein